MYLIAHTDHATITWDTGSENITKNAVRYITRCKIYTGFTRLVTVFKRKSNATGTQYKIHCTGKQGKYIIYKDNKLWKEFSDYKQLLDAFHAEINTVAGNLS